MKYEIPKGFYSVTEICTIGGTPSIEYLKCARLKLFTQVHICPVGKSKKLNTCCSNSCQYMYDGLVLGHFPNI